MIPEPKSIYESGNCRVLTYHDGYHELWHSGQMVAHFRSFRAAVTYLLSEFA